MSTILHQIDELKKKTMEITKTNFQVIVEEFDAAEKLTETCEIGDFGQSHIIFLPQPLLKERSCNIGNKSYTRETCLFHKLQNTLKIVKL